MVRSLNSRPAPASNDTAVGQLEHSFRLQRNDFGHAAVQHRQAGDPIALREAAAGRRAAHHARDLGARHERQLRLVLIEPAGLQGVGKRHPGRVDLDDDRARRRSARRSRRARRPAVRRDGLSELRASHHLTASGERGRRRLTVVFASDAERISRSSGKARRFAAADALPPCAPDDRPRRRRHPPARRGLRSRRRLSDRAGARHHLRHPGVGVPDRRPGPRLPGDRVRPPRPRPQRRADAARRTTASTSWPPTSTPFWRRRWSPANGRSSQAIPWAASRSLRGRSGIPAGCPSAPTPSR